MIHDPQVEITCDAKGCKESVFIGLHYVYGGTMHTDGRYDASEPAVFKSLLSETDWTVRDGKTYCESHGIR